MSTFTSYCIGYLLSIAMTFGAFGALMLHVHSGHRYPSHHMLMVVFVTFAILQMLVQLFFFLHIGRRQKAAWNSAALGFALFVICILVGGTLWILNNLSTHEMQMQNTYINGQVTVQNEND